MGQISPSSPSLEWLSELPRLPAEPRGPLQPSTSAQRIADLYNLVLTKAFTLFAMKNNNNKQTSKLPYLVRTLFLLHLLANCYSMLKKWGKDGVMWLG